LSLTHLCGVFTLSPGMGDFGEKLSNKKERDLASILQSVYNQSIISLSWILQHWNCASACSKWYLVCYWWQEWGAVSVTWPFSCTRHILGRCSAGSGPTSMAVLRGLSLNMLRPSRSHSHQVSHRARFWAPCYLSFTSDPSKTSWRLIDWTVWSMLMIRTSTLFWTSQEGNLRFYIWSYVRMIFKLSSSLTSWFVTRLRQNFFISHLGSLYILPYRILLLAKTLYSVSSKVVIWELILIVISPWQAKLTTSSAMHLSHSVTLVESGNISLRVVSSA